MLASLKFCQVIALVAPKPKPKCWNGITFIWQYSNVQMAVINFILDADRACTSSQKPVLSGGWTQHFGSYVHQYNCCIPKFNITPTIYAKEESRGNDEIDQRGVFMVRLCSWLRLRSMMMWGILSANTSLLQYLVPSDKWYWQRPIKMWGILIAYTSPS